MALAELAVEVLYTRSVLEHLGHCFDVDAQVEVQTKDPEAHRLIHKVAELEHGPIDVGTDNKGAYDLTLRATVGKHSRHVERKVFKMRELRTRSIVKITLIPTAEMAADALTKPLDDKTFAKHRTTIMNSNVERTVASDA